MSEQHVFKACIAIFRLPLMGKATPMGEVVNIAGDAADVVEDELTD